MPEKKSKRPRSSLGFRLSLLGMGVVVAGYLVMIALMLLR